MTLSNPQLFAIFPRDLMDRLIFIGDFTYAGAKEPYPLFQTVRVRLLSDDLHKMRIRTEGASGFFESVDSVERFENPPQARQAVAKS